MDWAMKSKPLMRIQSMLLKTLIYIHIFQEICFIMSFLFIIYTCRVVDIAASHYSNISAAMTQNSRVYMWGHCRGSSIFSF